MEVKNKERQIAKKVAFITSIFVIFMSITYAFVSQVLTGTKEVVVNAGVLDLVLEEENEITISDALPMYDQVGIIQDDAFIFNLVNKTSNPTDYILKLQEIGTSTLDKSIVKYGLIKEEEKIIDLVSNIIDEKIDEGTINGNDTINYELRLWIDSSVTDETRITGKSISFKLILEAAQKGGLVSQPTLLDWTVDDGWTETITVDNINLIKISDNILKKEDMLNLDGYIEMNKNLVNCSDNCIIEGVITQDMLDYGFKYDKNMGVLSYDDILYIAEKTVEIIDGVYATPGVWIIAANNSGTLIPVINRIIIGKPLPDTTFVTFAGITKEVNLKTKKNMFNYSNEGCILDLMTAVKSCPIDSTNGIYAMEDDDNLSYYYRGKVDNLVKFGSYTRDYYVYRYSNYDFQSLDACKSYNASCTEENKVLKYAASDNIPMYWRIIRVNGDGTIRMIYAGTTPDAKGYDTGIGQSRYNEEDNDPKYAGYTYDNTTTKTNSSAKTEIDNWYSNVLEGTKYDSDIATGKFCSDTSDYGEITDIWGDTYNAFGAYKRAYPNILGLSGDTTPTFRCPETSKDFGGNYNLKAGLITLDEIIAAGGQMVINESYYLSSGVKNDDDGIDFWSMSPTDFQHPDDVTFEIGVAGVSNPGIPNRGLVGYEYRLLRPVINLREDVVFKQGTDGSIKHPYELAE